MWCNFWWQMMDHWLIWLIDQKVEDFTNSLLSLTEDKISSSSSSPKASWTRYTWTSVGLMTATTYSPLYWPLFCIGTCWLITPSICHQAINLSSSKQSAQKMDTPCTWGSPWCRSSFLTKPPPRSTKHVSWLPTTGWSGEHHWRRSSSCCWIEIRIYKTLLGENYLRWPFL